MYSESLDRIIKSLAIGYSKSLNGVPSFDFDDLVQEGWISVLGRCAQSFDDTRGVEFNTYAYAAALQGMRDFIKKQMNHHKERETKDVSEIRDIPFTHRFEEEILVIEFLEIAEKISPEFADMVRNGIPKELFEEVKKHQRSICLRNNRKAIDQSFKLPLKVTNRFFKKKINKLSKIYYNCLKG